MDCAQKNVAGDIKIVASICERRRRELNFTKGVQTSYDIYINIYSKTNEKAKDALK